MSWHATLRSQRGSFRLNVRLTSDDGVLALVGPNGSGKTTVLRALAGAFEPDFAEIEIGGAVWASPHQRRSIEQRRVGYVPQGYGLFPHLSVLDNVAFGLSTGRRALDRATRRARALDALRQLGCADLADRRPTRLSGGEQQRVALARAWVVDPSLLLLDEPLAALDATTRRSVRRFLADQLPQLGRPTVLVTHDVRDVEALANCVVVIEGGEIRQTGTLDALRHDPASDFVAEFVGRP